MPLEVFWHEPPILIHSYVTTYVRNQKRASVENDAKCWLQGHYNRIAFNGKDYPKHPDTLVENVTEQNSVVNAFSGFIRHVDKKGLKLSKGK